MVYLTKKWLNAGKFCCCDDEKLITQQNLFVLKHLLFIFMCFIPLKIICCTLEKILESTVQMMPDYSFFKPSNILPTSKVHLVSSFLITKNLHCTSQFRQFQVYPTCWSFVSSDNFNFIVEHIILG